MSESQSTTGRAAAVSCDRESWCHHVPACNASSGWTSQHAPASDPTSAPAPASVQNNKHEHPINTPYKHLLDCLPIIELSVVSWSSQSQSRAYRKTPSDKRSHMTFTYSTPRFRCQEINLENLHFLSFDGGAEIISSGHAVRSFTLRPQNWKLAEENNIAINFVQSNN